MPERGRPGLLAACVGGHDQFCTGYAGRCGYLTALTLGIGAVGDDFTRAGSANLDAILAYDRAEIDDAYIGQINMITVSSFCGVEGLLWGYDVARATVPELPGAEVDPGLEGIRLRSARPLRAAARELFGTVDERRFPFLPGSHVFCAGKHAAFRGPAHLYAAVAIGIAADRSASACVLMEDVGALGRDDDCTSPGLEDGIMRRMARSVAAVGRNQRVAYSEILVDCITRRIGAGEVGCPLVAMPYLHLARAAYDERLLELDLASWSALKRPLFLEQQACRRQG